MTLRKFFADTKGNYALEFAIVVPILTILLLSILEYAMVMYITGEMEGGVVEAAREGGSAFQLGDDTQSQVMNIMGNWAPGAWKSGNMTMTTTAYNMGTNTGGTTNTLNGSSPCTANCMGAAGQVVVYTVTYAYPLFSPLLKGMLGNNGVYNISASAAVYNESSISNNINIIQ